MKRLYIVLVALFALYAAGIGTYLLAGDLFVIPPEAAGTAADPHTFMTADQITKAETFSRIHSLAYFVLTPLQALILIGLLGASAALRSWLEGKLQRKLLRLAAFVLLFSLLLELILLPVDYAMLKVNRAFGISNVTMATFWSDHAKNMLLDWIGTTFLAGLFIFVARRSPRRWWLWFWAASIPLILFVQFIQPVVVDPLFNHFEPLRNQELKQDILALAGRADIPAKQVYEVNMSERTNAINAYVNGIGGSARIVLWDTMLKKLQKDEILTVMAHEMGHYKERHMYWGIGCGIALSLLGCWMAFHGFRYFVRRWGPAWGLRGELDLAALPVLLVMVTLLSFVSAPAQNAFSRLIEHRADAYAMKMTGDGPAATRAFQKIAAENLSPVTQPPLIQWFRGSHPTILERIVYFEQFRK